MRAAEFILATIVLASLLMLLIADRGPGMETRLWKQLSVLWFASASLLALLVMLDFYSRGP